MVRENWYHDNVFEVDYTDTSIVSNGDAYGYQETRYIKATDIIPFIEKMIEYSKDSIEIKMKRVSDIPDEDLWTGDSRKDYPNQYYA